MSATHASYGNWLGKTLATTAALVLAPPDPGLLAWWLAGGLVVGQLLDSCLTRAAPGAAPEPDPGDPLLEKARALLGVGPEADRAAIRLAYRRQVSRWHPDRLPRDADPHHRTAAEARMCELREALNALLAAATEPGVKTG